MAAKLHEFLTSHTTPEPNPFEHISGGQGFAIRRVCKECSRSSFPFEFTVLLVVGYVPNNNRSRQAETSGGQKFSAGRESETSHVIPVAKPCCSQPGNCAKRKRVFQEIRVTF